MGFLTKLLPFSQALVVIGLCFGYLYIDSLKLDISKAKAELTQIKDSFLALQKTQAKLISSLNELSKKKLRLNAEISGLETKIRRADEKGVCVNTASDIFKRLQGDAKAKASPTR